MKKVDVMGLQQCVLKPKKKEFGLQKCSDLKHGRFIKGDVRLLIKVLSNQQKTPSGEVVLNGLITLCNRAIELLLKLS